MYNVFIAQYLEFYIPFLYTFRTRLFKRHQKLSWCIIYMIPVIFSFLYLGFLYFNICSVLSALVGVSLIYCLYELGYIYNDTETIKIECYPTLRLTQAQLIYYESHKIMIYGIRLFTSIVLTLVIYFYTQSYLFILSSWLILFLYMLYNSTRSLWNLPLHFGLVTLRFCTIPLLFTRDIPWTVILCLILIFPLLNTLERCREKRFNLFFFQRLIINNAEDGRYKYYGILFISGVFILGYQMIYSLETHITYIFLAYTFYYLTYRYFSYKYIMK